MLQKIYWILSFLFFYNSCTSTMIKDEVLFLQQFNLTGKGRGRFTGQQRGTFTFKSYEEKDQWILNIFLPLYGRKDIVISDQGMQGIELDKDGERRIVRLVDILLRKNFVCTWRENIHLCQGKESFILENKGDRIVLIFRDGRIELYAHRLLITGNQFSVDLIFN